MTEPLGTTGIQGDQGASHVIFLVQDGSVSQIQSDSSKTALKSEELTDLEEKEKMVQALIPPFVDGRKNRTKRGSSTCIDTRPYHRIPLVKSEDGKIFCTFCEKYFEDAEEFYEHIRQHATVKRKRKDLPCGQCDKTFDKLTDLWRHFHDSDPLDRNFVCSLCEKRFDRESQMRYHIESVHEKKLPFECRICQKRFFKHSELKNHVRIHLKIKKNICETCGRGFSHASNLKRHTLTHTKQRPYGCNNCGKRFVQLSALNAHKLTHEEERPVLPCCKCTKSFKTDAALRKHLKNSHLFSKEYAAQVIKEMKPNQKTEAAGRVRNFHCSACGKTFPYIKGLRLHMETHADDLVSCSTCHQSVRGTDIKHHSCDPVDAPRRSNKRRTPEEPEENMQGMIDNAEVIICLNPSELVEPAETLTVDLQTDGKWTVTERVPEHQEVEERQEQVDEEMTVEEVPFEAIVVIDAGSEEMIAEKNPMELKETDIVSQTPKFSCDKCNKTFSRATGLKQHLGIHDANMKKFKCSFCAETFAWGSSLKRHLMGKHASDQYGRTNLSKVSYACTRCGRDGFNSSGHLRQHIRRDHLKERDHVCDKCNKTFFTRHDLKVHYRTHLNERPYQCSQCGKKFSHVSHLIRHDKMHKGLRPYACEICGKTFTQGHSLKSHRLKCSDRTICNNCKGTFSTKEECVDHERQCCKTLIITVPGLQQHNGEESKKEVEENVNITFMNS